MLWVSSAPDVTQYKFKQIYYIPPPRPRPAPAPAPGRIYMWGDCDKSQLLWTRVPYLELHWRLVTSCVTWRLCTNMHSQHRHSYQHVDTQLHSYQHAAKLGPSIYHWTLYLQLLLLPRAICWHCWHVQFTLVFINKSIAMEDLNSSKSNHDT